MEERKKEEQHLAGVVRVIKANIAAYEREITVMNADIERMYEQYRDNDPEIFVELSNTITMNEHMKSALAKNLRALKKPYFGRVDITNEKKKEEVYYLGKGGVMKDTTTILVVDWRAPLAAVYYENGLGECTYPVPKNPPVTVTLNRKRTYEIEGENLIDYYDSEVVANDELLTKYLAKNKEAVLGEIIATIQKEQNDIIRKSPYRNMIVQGVAGSGKTTVAMHRISFILYNYEKEFRAEDFYIIGSNRILLNYITGVLPELDVHGVKQMTMEELFIRLLYEDWKEGRYRIVPCKKEALEKGGAEWFRKLEQYCEAVEWSVIPQESIWFEESELLSTEQIRNYIEENGRISVQAKINMLNMRALARLKNVITGREISFTAEEQRQITKAFTGLFGAKKWKRSVYEMYEEFLMQQGRGISGKRREFDVYDLAALAYLYKRIKETDPVREAHHIVVDEAQDYGMMAYSVLKYCIPGSTWTIMGDVSQNIRFGSGLNDWEELKELLLTDPKDSFGILSKSYRNTIEISEFAQKILSHGSFCGYPIEPIIRHGNPVARKQCSSRDMMLTRTADSIREWQEQGYDTIAVITRDREEAQKAAAELSSIIPVAESDLEKVEFHKGVMVLPVEYTKGLEFDAVVIFNPTKKAYPSDDGHAKLLYVAATRALHELIVVHGEDLTGLLQHDV